MQEFLENGVYRQPQEAGGPRQAAEKFVRTMGRKSPGIPYLVTSKAPDTKSEDWRRVVAVFVTGQTWQFKGWPHEVFSSPICTLSGLKEMVPWIVGHPSCDGMCSHVLTACRTKIGSLGLDTFTFSAA